MLNKFGVLFLTIFVLTALANGQFWALVIMFLAIGFLSNIFKGKPKQEVSQAAHSSVPYFRNDYQPSKKSGQFNKPTKRPKELEEKLKKREKK